MSPAAQAALDVWTIPWGFVAATAAIGAIYARGFHLLRAQMPERFSYWRLAAFIGGLTALLIAIASPLAAFDDLLLQVHMIQHIILMFVAPPLILIGAPAIPMVRGLPPALSRHLLGPALRASWVRRTFRALSHPVVCWMALAIGTWAWHVPAAYQLALQSEGWHQAEHACFFGAALLFWWPVVAPWPGARVWPRWAMVPYLLLADLQNTVLSALLVFSGRLIYPYYASVPRIGGISALDDQVAAGAIMWVPASLVFLVPGAVIVYRLLSPKNLSQRRAKIRAAHVSEGSLGEAMIRHG